jgi:hypothetical protein
LCGANIAPTQDITTSKLLSAVDDNAAPERPSRTLGASCAFHPVARVVQTLPRTVDPSEKRATHGHDHWRKK